MDWEHSKELMVSFIFFPSKSYLQNIVPRGFQMFIERAAYYLFIILISNLFHIIVPCFIRVLADTNPFKRIVIYCKSSIRHFNTKIRAKFGNQVYEKSKRMYV